MKLLVVSHPCVTPINQQFFAEVERQTGWALTIVAPANWTTAYGEREGLERWPTYDGELIPVPVWGSGNVPLHVYRSFFVAQLQQAKPDAIYVHNEPYAAATGQVYAANRFTVQAPIGFYSAQNIFKAYPLPFQWLERFVHKCSHFSFPITQRVLNVLRKRGYKGPASILPLGIDPSLYEAHSDNRELRQALEICDDEVLIGYVGRVDEEKGLRTLFRALHRIELLPWKLAIVGEGELTDELKARAEEKGLGERIRHVGYVSHDEVSRYLSAFDVFALPSETQENWKEQFGRVIIEALACGTPVVGSDSGEIPHLIEATGGGLVFPEGKADSLAACLTELIQDADRRQMLVEAGRQTVLRDYTQEALAKQFAEVIERAVA